MDPAPILSNLREITQFLESIGLPVRGGEVAGPSFLPGIEIRQGVLTYDPGRLLYPGDLLHEAGHLAMMLPQQRALAQGHVGDDGGLELAAIAWSWAAALAIGLDPRAVFHEAGYKGASANILENFAAGRYVGVPVLEWAGLCAPKGYPAMLRWLRPSCP